MNANATVLTPMTLETGAATTVRVDAGEVYSGTMMGKVFVFHVQSSSGKIHRVRVDTEKNPKHLSIQPFTQKRYGEERED